MEWKCNDCGAVFSKPKVIHDDPSPIGISLPKGHYTYLECPKCESENIQEGLYCIACEENEVSNNPDFCENCMDIINNELMLAYDKVAKKINNDLSFDVFRDMVDAWLE